MIREITINNSKKMTKLNDLKDNLDENIDMTHIFPITKSKPKKKLWKNIIKDIYHSLCQIDLRGQKIVQYYKNKTKNFDGIHPQDNNLVIDLNSKENSFWENIQIFKDNFYWKLPKIPNFNITPFPLLVSIFIVIVLYIASSRFIVENQVKSGYEKLSQLWEMKANLEQVESQISKAKGNFYIAKAFFLPYYLIPTKQVENGKLVIGGWIRLISTLQELLYITEQTQNFIAEKWIKEVKFSQLLLNLQPALLKSQNEISQTIESYKKLELDDNEMQKKLETNIKKLETGNQYLNNINTNFSIILEMLWHTKEKKYLIVFQNADEIRPTGWFMGSMAIMGLFRGQITEFSPKDVYDLEWNLKKSGIKKELPPEGIDKITDSFGLRDANYFVNFDESSKKIQYFSEKAGFPIDGIVYLNHTVILDFLKVTWAIKFDKIGQSVDENNFSELISILVESKKFKSGTLDTPKQILFDFAQIFFHTLQEQKEYKKYIKILLQNLENREIVFYPFERGGNEFITQFRITGEINYAETLDYMYPVFTSISWNKSDRYIKRIFEKYMIENPDCSVENTFRILQTHDFQKNDEKRIQEEFTKYGINDKDNTLLNIQWKWTNKQYVRVILPREAQIKKNKNIKIEPYGNRQSVNFYTEVNPWETRVFDVSYTIPNESCSQYKFKLYKQPWIKNFDIKIDEVWKKENTYKNLETDFFYEVRK